MSLKNRFIATAMACVVSAFMLCGAAGMLSGGFLAARAQRLESVIAGALCFGAALFLLAATGWLPPFVAAACVAAAGFGTGLAGPSRDMLIKRATPPGATGRVYGTVYSGLDVGFALAAPVFGALLDSQGPSSVLLGAAMALLGGIASATFVGWATRKPRPAMT